ncbi:MAG: sensor histidine kinase [Thermoplasmatota archaeon]
MAAFAHVAPSTQKKLEANFRNRLPAEFTFLAIVYALSTPMEYLVIGGSLGRALSMSALTLALGFALAALATSRFPPPARFAQPLALVAVAAILAQASLLMESQTPYLFVTFAALVAMAAGSVFVSWRWTAVAGLMSAIAWAIVVPKPLLPSTAFFDGTTLLLSAGVSILLCALRIEAYAEIDDLRDQRIRAQGEIAEKTRLLNTASHELNTPLTPLKIHLHLLAAGDLGALNDAQKASVRALERNVDRLAHLVSDVLDVARLQSGSLKSTPVKVDLEAILSDVRDTFEAPAKFAGINLTIDPAGGVSLRADPRRLTQVLVNLVGNALKVSSRGETVHLRAVADGPMVRFSVTDEGIGLTGGQIARLFHPFTHLHENVAGGTGLGLYICRGIVEQHGGAIWAESRGPGRGATFSFSLPATGPPTPVASLAPALSIGARESDR